MLLAAVAGAAVASILINQTNEISERQRRRIVKDEIAASKAEDRRYRNHTGQYGDMSGIFEIVGNPNSIIKKEHGVDLYGSPCVWNTLTNGAKYRTYDTKKGIVTER